MAVSQAVEFIVLGSDDGFLAILSGDAVSAISSMAVSQAVQSIELESASALQSSIRFGSTASIANLALDLSPDAALTMMILS